VHVFLIPHWFTLTAFSSVALLAFWRGDWRARAIAGSLIVMIAYGQYVCHTWVCWTPTAPPFVFWGPVIEDGFVLLVCLACARRAERYWVLWACSFALLSFVSDLMGHVPHVTPWADASASLIFTYLLTATLLIGVCSSPRATA
jgi:hypothetical protein